MPAGWTIGQITHCSSSLLCSDSLPVHSSPATAVGEADPTTSASIGKQAGKTLTTTAVASAATIARQVGKQLAPTVATTATIARQIAKTAVATVASTALVVKQARKTFGSSAVASSASLAPTFIHPGVTNPLTLQATTVTTTASLAPTYIRNPVTTPQPLTATITTSATLSAVKVTPVVPGRDAQEIGELVAAVAGGVGY